MSIWGSIKHAVHHAAHAVAKGAKKAGKVAGSVVGQPVEHGEGWPREQAAGREHHARRGEEVMKWTAVDLGTIAGIVDDLTDVAVQPGVTADTGAAAGDA